MSPRPPVDEHVEPVEALLSRTATYRELPAGSADPVLEVTWALWLCPCYSDDDAPTWLLLHEGDHRLGWSRVPDGVDVESVVAAERVTGGHTETFGVLAWLRGETRHPWLVGDDDEADQEVVEFFTGALCGPSTR